MNDLKLTRDEKLALVPLVQDYARDELDRDLGDFEAEFLVEFFAETLGPLLYNRGLHDAQAMLHRRIDSIGEVIVELEKPLPFVR
ncbi:MAG: DUF2164 domain-containing protein [Acidobacteriota bacterium]